MNEEYECCFGPFRPMRLYEDGLDIEKYIERIKCCIDELSKVNSNVIKHNKKVLNLLGVGVNQTERKFHTIIITKSIKSISDFKNVIVKDYAKCRLINCKCVIIRESADVKILSYKSTKNQTFSYDSSIVNTYGYTNLIADNYTKAILHGESRCCCREFANIKCKDKSNCHASGYSFVKYLDNSTGSLCSHSRELIDNNSDVLVDDNACFITYGSPKIKVMSYGFGDVYGEPKIEIAAGNPTLKIHDEFSGKCKEGLDIVANIGIIISQRPFDGLKLGGFAIHKMNTKEIISVEGGERNIQLSYREYVDKSD